MTRYRYKINGRLRRAQGRYISSHDGKPLRIEITKFLLKYGTRNVILRTLRHELIHYVMHIKDRPYDDGHPEFEEELRKQKAPSTGADKVGIRYITKCTECGKESETIYKSEIKQPLKYRTRCCRADYKYIGNAIYNGEVRKEVLFDCRKIDVS